MWSHDVTSGLQLCFSRAASGMMTGNYTEGLFIVSIHFISSGHVNAHSAGHKVSPSAQWHIIYKIRRNFTVEF